MGEFEFDRPAPRALVCFNQDGSIELNVTSLSEARLALKVLVGRSRELQSCLCQVSIQCQRLRFEYGDWSRRQSAAGGCGFGRLARSAMVGQRANMRIDLAGKLEPLYARKVSLNAMILAADLARMRLEAYARDATTLD